MPQIKPLPAKKLYRRCDPRQFSFKTTDDLGHMDRVIGQDRALEAMRFGIGMAHKGYNLFVLGPPRTGRHNAVRRCILQKAATEKTPQDLCYVHNFKEAHRPHALALPKGRGAKLREDMDRLAMELKQLIPAVLESDDCRNRRQSIEREFKERQTKAFEQVHKEASAKGIGPVRTPSGMVLAPIKNGEPVTPDDFNKLPQSEQDQIRADIDVFEQKFQAVTNQVPQWEREARDKMRELSKEIVGQAVMPLILELGKKYDDLPEVIEYLETVQTDVVVKSDQFLQNESSQKGSDGAPQPSQMPAPAYVEPDPFRRFRINVLVDHSESKGAPVVFEDHPTVPNILGRVEHLAHLGALLTDFNLIKAGALHRANGGYLVMDARRILSQPLAWEELKRAIRSREIRIESLGQATGIVSTVTLDPEPMPLKVKVVLVGDRMTYYLLSSLDPDFRELFKVPAEFDDRVDRTSENERLFATLIGDMVRREKLKPFDKAALTRVIEHASRLADDSEKLSTEVGKVLDLLCESNFWATESRRRQVGLKDVERALESQVRRADRVRERLQEEVLRGTRLISVDGEKVGQINALSVLQLGGFSFGQPTRISAQVRIGKGQILDIEREVALGGPLHSKGILILTGFLAGRYARDLPLCLNASLVFEQSYSGVDGDSASSAELYALLSALADAPIRQSFAVTGSVNQAGEVQAIGGVNEKIEGFFDACVGAGLTGKQGVLIPVSNVKNLMLRKDVVQAVEVGKFAIYPVERIDQGIEVLTGIPSGRPRKDGRYPEGTINRRVSDRLQDLAQRSHSFGKS